MIRVHHRMIIIAGGFIVIAFALFYLLQSYGTVSDSPQKPLIGFSLQGKFASQGWNHRNYEGIEEAAKRAGLLLESREGVLAGSMEASQMIGAMERSGKKVLFLASADYTADMQAARQLGSKLIFAIPALEQVPDAQCIPYFVRLYQAEYLAGTLAGLRTKSGLVGYVASQPMPETVRGINAFTLGVRQSNPAARVLVFWVGSWDDANQERYAAERLIAVGADVLNSHQDQTNVQRVASAHDIDYFAYQDPLEDSSGHNIATVVCDWSVVYGRILQDFQQGRMQPRYWMGLPEKAVDLADFSPLVTEPQRQRLTEVKHSINSGHTIFSGEIRDRQGVLRCAADESISDNTLVTMDWFVEGVDFYEEKY